MAKTVSLSDANPNQKTPSSQSATEQKGDKPEKEELIPLQFKMPRSWVRDFKLAAAGNEMKLNELLKECFTAFMNSPKKD
jgi:hypothetical protein